MRFSNLFLALFILVTSARAADLKPPQWGEPKDGLRTRLMADTQVFRAGDPITMKLEMENVGEKAREYGFAPAPHYGTLKVVDEAGKEVPYLFGLAQVQQHREKLEPGKPLEIGSFDLAQAFYLRKPGRYTAQAIMEPASAPFEFEVIANPAGAADGDPIGRMLPLVKKDWWLSGSGTGDIRPGKNRAMTTGRYLFLHFNPTGYKKDNGLIWVWLADQPADEKLDETSHLPASEYVGKIGRWHVYTAVTDAAQKAWPTAKDDIAKALKTEPK